MTINDPYRDPLHFLKGIIVFGNNEAFALCHYVVTLPKYIMEIEIFFPRNIIQLIDPKSSGPH